jgi:FkbH-like protein
MRFLAPLAGKTVKAVVVDLDNTLWGGVVGEDGINGIKVGSEYPGAAYQSLQRSLLDLSRRGILLAICSKNNAEDALEALDRHPGMLLRSKDFAAVRINWQDKPLNLRSIAQELNIGSDALAFVDDNPFECAQVRAALPEVIVIELPANPMEYASTLLQCPGLERLTLSAEDQQRGAIYRNQRLRSQAEQSFQTREDFFRYLQQVVRIEPVNATTLARVAQLTQKTNQFNLTTRRYTEEEIARLIDMEKWRVLSIRVSDRLGEQGLVGVAVTRDQGDVCELDTFLLSCRVIGRTVETAFVAAIAKDAAERGCKTLIGWFLPTKKNAPAQEFYAQHGFQEQERNGHGILWALPLDGRRPACPDWIHLISPDGGHS